MVAYFMSLWFNRLCWLGKPFSWILFFFILGSSGVLYLFIDHAPKREFFQQQIVFPQGIISTFFQSNENQYLLHMGKFIEAKKHGIRVTNTIINKYLNKIPQVCENGEFNKEKYEKLLKDQKITKNEFFCYVEQLISIEIFYKVFEETKIKFEVPSESQFPTVLGSQYTLKDRSPLLPPTKEELSNFYKFCVNKKMALVLSSEKRSGFVIVVNNYKKPFTEKEIMIHRTKDNLINFFKGYECTIKEFQNVSSYENFELFKYNKIVEKDNKLFITVITDIETQHIKHLNEKETNNLKRLCSLMYQSHKDQIKICEIANDLRNKTYDIKKIKHMLQEKPFFLSRVNTKSHALIASLPMGSPVLLRTYDDQLSIIIVDYKNIKTLPSQIEMKDFMRDFFKTRWLDINLTYWINRNPMLGIN